MSLYGYTTASFLLAEKTCSVIMRKCIMYLRQGKCAGRCDIELGDVTRHNVMQLKRLNMAVFPVSYNDKFYKEVVSAGQMAKRELPSSSVCSLLRYNHQLCSLPSSD